MAQRVPILVVIAAIAALLALAGAILVPKMRYPIAAISGGIVLLVIRQRFFPVPGVRAMPFGRTAGALLTPKAKDKKM